MQIYSDPIQLQKDLIALKRAGLTIAFVPTMGNLHEGHISLVRTAKQKADRVISSIFVNPLQFGPNEDFDNYPRTLEQDIHKLTESGCDYLFTPNITDIYPLGQSVHTCVEANRLTDKLCGASRPGHFKGVTTVVNILFNLVQPDIAIFGKKDYQQLQVIKTMVNDLRMPIQIIGGEIVREANGLAMSSRNGYLSEVEKAQAAQLRQEIISAAKALQSGTQKISEIESAAINHLSKAGFVVDYFTIVSRSTLEQATDKDKALLIAAAAWLGKPRLIDNLEVDLA